jgi:predicted peptidase
MAWKQEASMFSKCMIASTAILACFASAAGQAQDVVDGFVSRTLEGPDKRAMSYRLFEPEARLQTRPLPLIVYLHGASGAGTDNLKQIRGGNTVGTHLWTAPAMQARHPSFVVAPQIPLDVQWGAPASDQLSAPEMRVLDLVSKLSKEFAIDADRVYLVGQSRGARGTWDLISKRPDVFAAAVPLCGDGNATRIRAARHVPIWAFHGAKDTNVPVSGSRDLVAALRSAGSAVKYTEYPDVEHDVWTVAFAEKELPEWLFAQSRASRAKEPQRQLKRT